MDPEERMGSGDFQALRLLGLVRVLGTGVDLEAGGHAPTEGAAGQHADHGLANVDVNDEGVVTITGGDETQVDACAARIAELVDADLGR